MREIRTLRAMWRALETGFSLKIYAPALDPTGDKIGFASLPVFAPMPRASVKIATSENPDSSTVGAARIAPLFLA